MGRKPKPTALKEAEGNPSGRPLPANEPRPSRSRLKLPDRIKGNKVAEKEYRRLGKELVETGVMTVLDERALGEVAIVYSKLVKLDKKLDEQEDVLTGKAGGQYQNPLSALVSSLRREYWSMLSEFGMTPSGRTKVRTNAAVANGGKGTLEALLPTVEADQIARAAEEWVPPTLKASG